MRLIGLARVTLALLTVAPAGCGKPNTDPDGTPPVPTPAQVPAPPTAAGPAAPAAPQATLADVLAADAKWWAATAEPRRASQEKQRQREADLAAALRKKKLPAGVPPEVVGEVNLYRKIPTGSSFGAIAALSPDGTRIVIAETDLSFTDKKRWNRVVDLLSLEAVSRFDVGDGGVIGAGVVFSSDGSVLATGRPNGQVSVWDADKGTLRNRVDVGGYVWSLAPFPDGTGWVASVEGSPVKIDATGAVVKTYGPRAVHASLATVSPSGSMVAAYTRSGSPGKPTGGITLWDASTGARLAEFERQGLSGIKLMFAPDGRTLYSHENDVVVAWDVPTGASRDVVRAKNMDVPELSPDGDLIAYYSDPELVLHHLGSGKQRRLRTKAYWPDSNPVFFPGGTLLATSSNSHFVVWDLALARPPKE
ncbi:nacht and wd domain protein : Putative nacht and wd domain protein OS=Botryotinia fuckeliana (strain BcDW1) GN=BcDW1_2130 PE=4 SV=1 [Gemmataceae bacterium]|nr:nacht and wd domain protein : Putative nacht and wd domain protein OS=Botryotinia fuckeliana (strain BcDW1) GN=BcDW1_2130 PE=4 SV=1 [Gemmataceae bacterium]VTU00296.1 nacht and wd domain protein : Putative nacht and wd domain protein OS=Botryotinia fuckeliana (strain BcDW1) GN=BcDW1_2130 PE=4 SV=1 [Gemmataceae bacterium]